jgi:hypothetical protein
MKGRRERLSASPRQFYPRTSRVSILQLWYCLRGKVGA